MRTEAHKDLLKYFNRSPFYFLNLIFVFMINISGLFVISKKENVLSFICQKKLILKNLKKKMF